MCCGDRGGGGRLGDEEFAHAQGEEGEGLGELIACVLTAAVMPTVMVIPGERKDNSRYISYQMFENNVIIMWKLMFNKSDQPQCNPSV